MRRHINTWVHLP